MLVIPQNHQIWHCRMKTETPTPPNKFSDHPAHDAMHTNSQLKLLLSRKFSITQLSKFKKKKNLTLSILKKKK